MLLMEGLISLIRAIPLGIVIYVLVLFVLKLFKIRTEFILNTAILEFICLLYLLMVLDITGILGMEYKIDWFMNSVKSIGLYLPVDMGDIKMTILNTVLFIPLGILTPVVLKKINLNWKKYLILAMCFSVGIELLQMFAGRNSEVNDVLANTLGFAIGYLILRKLDHN